MAENGRQIDLKSLCRGYTEANVRALGGFANSPELEADTRIRAIALLLERGWGKAPQAHTGPDGEGDIRVTIRQIIETVGKKPEEPNV